MGFVGGKLCVVVSFVMILIVARFLGTFSRRCPHRLTRQLNLIKMSETCARCNKSIFAAETPTRTPAGAYHLACLAEGLEQVVLHDS